MADDFDAQAALDAATDTRTHLADRVQTPWWYHPCYGIFIAVTCLALGLPAGTISHQHRLYLFLLVIIGNFAVTQVYRHVTGVWIQTAVGPRTRRLMIEFAIGLVLAFAASVANYLWHGPWWTPVVIGAAAIVAATLFGRHYDEALRAEMRAGASP